MDGYLDWGGAWCGVYFNDKYLSVYPISLSLSLSVPIPPKARRAEK